MSTFLSILLTCIAAVVIGTLIAKAIGIPMLTMGRPTKVESVYPVEPSNEIDLRPGGVTSYAVLRRKVDLNLKYRKAESTINLKYQILYNAIIGKNE
jgi:hypothetical protein